MVTDSAAPATKKDIALLMEQMGGYYDKTEGRMGNLEGSMGKLEGRMGNLEGRMGSLEGRMGNVEGRIVDLEERLESWKQEIKGHFDLIAENLLYDFRGAHRDDIENVKIRLTRVEKKVGINP